MPEHTGEGEILEAHQETLDLEQPPPFAGIPFITDDDLIARLKQAENAVTDLEMRAGHLKRELGELRVLLEPRVT